MGALRERWLASDGSREPRDAVGDRDSVRPITRLPEIARPITSGSYRIARLKTRVAPGTGMAIYTLPAAIVCFLTATKGSQE